MSSGRIREPLQLVIWDYDGTLVDTETPYWEAWTAEFRLYGLELPIDLWSTMMQTDENPAEVLRQQFAIDVPEERVQEINRSVFTAIRRSGYMPGALALLDQCFARNLQVALITNGSENWLRATMPTGLRERFHFVETSAAKPNFGAHESLLERTGIQARNAIGIEDTPWGLDALRGANIAALYVPSTPYRNIQIAGVVSLPSLKGLTTERLSLARPLPEMSSSLELL